MIWYRTLGIRAEWEAAKDGRLTIPELCGVVAKKLYKLAETSSDKFAVAACEWADEFDSLTEGEVTTEEFDDLWEEFYDWADSWLDSQTKCLWVRIR